MDMIAIRDNQICGELEIVGKNTGMYKQIIDEVHQN